MLLAVLMVLEAVPAAYNGLTATPETLAGNDRIGYALNLVLYLPIPIFFGLAPFFLAAMLGFRLLVPTFAGAPPRAVAALVVAWPVMLGAWAVTMLPTMALWMAVVALVWSRLMPLPKQDILRRGPVAGGIVIGMALSSLAVLGALVAAIAPGLLQTHDLLTLNYDQHTVVGSLMILALLGLAIGGLVLSSRRQEKDDAVEEPA